MKLTREEIMELIRKDIKRTMEEYHRILVKDYYTVKRDYLGRVIENEKSNN